MAKTYLIPLDATAKSTIGGDCTAQDWYNTRDNANEIIGHGDGNTVKVKFAVSGDIGSEVWGDEFTLNSTNTSFDADLLKAGMDAGIKYSGVKVVVAYCTASSGNANFWAVINGKSEEHWFVLS